MKKRKTIIWTIVVIVVVGGFGIFLRSCTLEAMRIREASMRDYICTWILFSYEGTEKQLAEFLEKASSNFYLTNQVFTFDGSNIVARFAYSGQVDDKQLFSSADYQFFWANRSGKIVRGPTEKEPIKETEQRICLERETVRNMKNFIEGWMRELYKGTEESLDEFVQTNTNAIFLTNQVFSFGGSNITARFASPRIVDDRRQLFANTNMYFWVDSRFGNILGEPHKVGASEERSYFSTLPVFSQLSHLLLKLSCQILATIVFCILAI